MNLKCQLVAGQKSMALPLILRQFQSLRCMLSKYYFRSMFLWQSVTLSQADYKIFTALRRRSTRWRCQVNRQSLQALRSRCGQFCLGWRNTLQEHWKNCAACDLHHFCDAPIFASQMCGWCCTLWLTAVHWWGRICHLLTSEKVWKGSLYCFYSWIWPKGQKKVWETLKKMQLDSIVWFGKYWSNYLC